MFSPIIEDEMDKKSASTLSKPTTRGSIRERQRELMKKINSSYI